MTINKNKIIKLGAITILITTFLFYLKEKSIVQQTEASSEIEIVDLEEENYNKIKSLVEKNKDDISRLVNKDNPVGVDYVPNDLINTTVQTARGNVEISKSIEDDLEDMFQSAQNDNIYFCITTGYRSAQFQDALYRKSLEKNGKEHADKYIAKPGYSEHQTGLAIDISCKSKNYKLTTSFGDTEEGKWLAENSYKFGFILRYKEGREEDTGYAYEPWHFRYVGKEIATYLYENNLILEDLYK